MKSMIRNIRSTLRGPKAKRRSSMGDMKMNSSKPKLRFPPELDMSQRTDATEVLSGMEPSACLFEQAFFKQELTHLKLNPSIRRVTLKDFVQRYERGDLLALHDILGHKRQWKAIKFQDTIEGESYRRWLFKKENLRRTLEKFCCDETFPIVFEEHIKIDMDDAAGDKLFGLLRDMRRDIHVVALSFDGFLNHQDIEPFVNSLVDLLTVDGRRWKKIMIRCSFDGEEFDTFNSKIAAAKTRLHNISVQHGIPIFMKVC